MNTELIVPIALLVAAIVAGVIAFLQGKKANAMPATTDDEKKARRQAFVLPVILAIVAVAALVGAALTFNPASAVAVAPVGDTTTCPADTKPAEGEGYAVACNEETDKWEITVAGIVMTPEQIAQGCTQGVFSGALCDGKAPVVEDTTCPAATRPEDGAGYTVSCNEDTDKWVITVTQAPVVTTCPAESRPADGAGYTVTCDEDTDKWVITVTQAPAIDNGGAPAGGNTGGTPLEAGVGFIQLNYDKNPAYKGNCMDNTNLATDALVAGQTSYPAFEICKANAAGDNQVDLETAIAAIQLQAQNAGAKTLVGNTITLPNESAWLVWIPNASTFDASTLPNDVAFPTGLVHPALGQIWIVPAYAAGINGRTFQNADYAFYAVALK